MFHVEHIGRRNDFAAQHTATPNATCQPAMFPL